MPLLPQAQHPAAAREKQLRPHGRQRRRLLQALPMLAVMPTALAQQNGPVAVRKLHSCDIRVSDLERSLRFYQDLFGAPMLVSQAGGGGRNESLGESGRPSEHMRGEAGREVNQGNRVVLRVGEGPQFFSLSQAAPGEPPGFSHIGLSVADFDIETARAQLAAAGIRATAAPGSNERGLELASRSWVRDHNGNAGLYFADIEGLVYHLYPENYCGVGGGAAGVGDGQPGENCAEVEMADSAGLFSLIDYSHFTNFVANRGRANAFYTATFGKRFQAYQGPSAPVIGVGDGLQFLMYVGGDAEGIPAQPARIDHVCFSVETFDVDAILARLSDYGLVAREDPADTRALMHWVSMRMPNRGGAPEGTPELYFTDPDGIRVQLQHRGYCGGTGYLGDSCPPLI